MSYVGSLAARRSVAQHLRPKTAAIPLLSLPKSTPLWMAAAYMWFFIIRPWERLFPWMQVAPVEKILAIALLASVLFSTRTRYRFGFQSGVVVAFLGVLLVSAIAGFSFERSWEQVYKYFTMAVFYFVIVWVVRRPNDLFFLVIAYLTSAMAFLAKSEWEYVVHGSAQFQMGVRRLVGINVLFGHANSVAAMIVTTLPLVYFLWTRRDDVSAGSSRRWRTFLKVGLIAYTAVAISALILTNSRSGMITAIFLVFLISLGKKGGARKLGAVVTAVVLVITTWAFMPEDSRNRLRTVWNPEAGPANAEASMEGRLRGLRVGLQLFQAYPALGVGVGNFGAYRQVHLDGDFHEAHNLLGQILGEIGALGLVSFMFVVGTVLANCTRIIRLSRRRNRNLNSGVFSDFAVACRNIIFVLLFLGIGGHNMLSFTWLWTAAFAFAALCLMNDLGVDDSVNRESGTAAHASRSAHAVTRPSKNPDKPQR